MPAPEPDHVEVLAAQLHVVDCLPGAMTYRQYSQRHRDVHTRRARLVLTGLRNAGYTITTLEEDR